MTGPNNDWAQHEFFHVGFETIMNFPLCTILENLCKPKKTLELMQFCRDQVNTLRHKFCSLFLDIV